MSYEIVDHSIDGWVARHSLMLKGKETDKRAVYISSKSGETYQIWVGLPSEEQVKVSAVCIEGVRDEDPEKEWVVDVGNIDDGLEEAYRTVVAWMAPSERL